MTAYLTVAVLLLGLAAAVITRRRRAAARRKPEISEAYFRHDPGFADCVDPRCCGIPDGEPDPAPCGSPRITRFERHGLDGLPRPVYWSSGDPFASGEASGLLSPWKPAEFCSWQLDHCAEPAVPGDLLGYCIGHRNCVLGAARAEVAQ